MHILVIENDADDPVALLGEWLAEAGASLDIRRPYAGDALPADLAAHDALVVLGGAMGAYDDADYPWLARTKDLLRTGVRQNLPTLGVCLGAQLLAVAMGGTVETGEDGPEVGAFLVAKRDAADRDPIFVDLPMMPDVMHCHFDVITELPPEAALLYLGQRYPHQAFRIGKSAWGLQFHIEADAATVRRWAAKHELTGRLGDELDEAEENMAVVWKHFAQRFVAHRPRLDLPQL